METKKPPKSNPLPETLQTIKGYPERLKIYRIRASPYWWVRATFGDRRITRSTKETDRARAVAFAKNFYDECLLTRREIPLETSRQFGRCADLLLEECQRRASAGERNPRFARDLKQILDQRILPFFKTYRVSDLTYQHLSLFADSMRKDQCSASTIKRALVSVRQVLKHAVKLGLIQQIPIFPTISHKESPRPWFSPEEYEQLKNAAELEAKKEPTDLWFKGERITEEMREFILFMVNTFLRPSDWVELKRKHVKVVTLQKTKDPVLIIETPKSKTINTPIISMAAAVGVYRNILQRQDAAGAWHDESYVFLPHIPSRPHAAVVMRNLFDLLLRSSGLKKNYAAQSRSIYSLRHTAIAMRFLRGTNVDIVLLARNCRTSVEMIDRFYAKHLSAMMDPDRVISLQPSDNRDRKLRAKKHSSDAVDPALTAEK